MREFEVQIAVSATVRLCAEGEDADAAAARAEAEFFKNFDRYMTGIDPKACYVEAVEPLDDEDEEE